jgi:hypothetical protein
VLAGAAVLTLVGCTSPGVLPPAASPSVSPVRSEQTAVPTAPSGCYTEPYGYWTITYAVDTWQPDANDEQVLHHISYPCALVLAGWPMGMEGPEAEFFEMREKQVPVELGDHVFQRSVLAATSAEAPYTAEVAYYLSEGDVFAHIVLVAGKEIYDRPQNLALCQEDAEVVVGTLSTQ